MEREDIVDTEVIIIAQKALNIKFVQNTIFAQNLMWREGGSGTINCTNKIHDYN